MEDKEETRRKQARWPMMLNRSSRAARAAREAAEAAARSEAEQVESAYDQAIAAADEAYVVSNGHKPNSCMTMPWQ